jgi:signal transduction histidine kinase/CheY-like chemotaxis protein
MKRFRAPVQMASRTPRLRLFIGTIVAACALGGLLLAFELAYLFQGIEGHNQELRASVGRLTALEAWGQSASAWLRSARAALEEVDRRGEVADQAEGLLVTLEKLEDQCRPAFADELEGLRLKLDSALEGLRMAPDPALPGARAELEAVARAFDGDDEIVGLGEDVARDLDLIRAGLRAEVVDGTAALEERRDGLWRTVILSALGYGLIVLVLWRWLVRNLIQPLQTLTEEARLTLEGERELALVPAGPLEVRQLNESLTALVAGLVGARETLEEKVALRTSELERANRAKNEFLANMSHEIRTPMTAILGYAELCLAPEVTEEDERRYIEIIHANGEHLLSVINDILDVSKIEAGQMTIEPTLCSPSEIVAEVQALMEVRASARGLALEIEAGEVPEVVRTDPTRLRQILLNLVTNAIKFTEQGRVVIRHGLEAGAAGQRLVFEVRDTGMGMSPGELERVFQPFVQADTSTTRRFGGSGLGLTISRTLARMMGGDLTCSSTEGAGSSFRVEIDPGPLEGVRRLNGQRSDAPLEPAAVRRWSAPTSELSGRVLLAEDVAVNRRLIATLLRRTGLEVEEAENGLVAVEKARASVAEQQPFAILFMDMQMPEMDGYAATRTLRSEGYAGPIVALTSHSMSGERERCLEVGCDEYMTKPVDRKVLLQVLARFLPVPGPATEVA